MFQFSANLNFLFTEVSPAERFKAAAAAGFKAVECMFPQEFGLVETQRLLAEAGVRLCLFNIRAGNWSAGERGLACLAGREEEFYHYVDEAAAFAACLGVTRVNCLSGIAAGDPARAEDVLVERVRHAADRCAKAGLTLLLENINTLDMPGFLVSTTQTAFRVMDRAGRDNVKLQYDIYHAQRMEGELVGTLRAHKDRIGHIQVADNPGRGQPGTGEIAYRFVLEAIRDAGYDGCVGLEYVPTPDTAASLGWIGEYGFAL